MTEYNEAGFMKNPDEWTEIEMHKIANREGINLSARMVELILSCREQYEINSAVPPLREFSKLHGGDRKGKELNELFNGQPMAKIEKLGGLPQPTGCI